MRVDWSDTAPERVSEIALHIAQDDCDAAIRWTGEIFDAVEQLSEFPESGRIVPELGAREVRELIFGAYLIFYRVDAIVEVLTVRHASQLLRLGEVGGD
jgi:toxin ParE1/3/4